MPNQCPLKFQLGKTVTMNVSVVDGDEQLVPGESVKVRVAVAVPYSTSVKPITVSLQPNVAGSDFKLCGVLINYIGKDISCLEHRRESLESAVTYTSTG